MKTRSMLAALGVVAVLAAAAWWIAVRPHAPHVPADLSFQSVGALRVGLFNVPDPPRSGENQLVAVVRDADGRPLRGATLEARVVMEAMGSMPRMESRGAFREVGPGIYRANYGLSMAGDWDLSLRVTPRGESPLRADYRLSTMTNGLAFAGGTAASGAATPVAGDSAGAAEDGVVTIDAARRQTLGIRTEVVERRDLVATVRAAGRVSWDETRLHDVTLKFAGYVRTLSGDFTGRTVHAGEPLLTVYSPELLSAQQEYLEAVRAAALDPAARDLADAARRRLLLWDVPVAQVEGIAREGRVRDEIPVLAPATGVITEKRVVAGSPFAAGDVLFRLAPIDPVWVMAAVYQVDLPLVKVGAPVTLSNPYLDGGSRKGRVAFVDPTLSSDTRTGSVRIEVPNPKGDLKPGMFVDAVLESPLGSRLAVPESAVLPTGERRVVFVDLGQGRLAPRDVRLGAQAGDWYEVLGGLAAGDRVVTSGNFLISSEAKLRSAGEKW
jgi:Cu(I)/Ag(I) efflux system membrane fusion protein